MTMQSAPVRFAESDQDKVERLITQGGATLAALALLLRSGQISTAQFIERATAELRQHAHQAAGLAGGSVAAASAVDTLIDDRAQYLDGFAEDIAAGDVSEKQLAARTALWGGLAHTAWQMAQTATEQRQADAEGTTLEGDWDCVGDKESCESCLALAAGSPYTPDTLPTHPGEDVACGGNCRCEIHWRRVPADEADFSRIVYGSPLHFGNGPTFMDSNDPRTCVLNCICGPAYLLDEAAI